MKKKCISNELLKRIQVAEGKVKVSHVPDLIMIDYDGTRQKYIIRETYTNSKGTGGKRKENIVGSLRDYMFPPGFIGTCIMDLMAAPVLNPNLYVFRGTELRKEGYIEKDKGFYLALDDEQEAEGQGCFRSYEE